MQLFFVTFATVMLRGIQQQNVIHERYKWALIFSFLIAIAEVGLIMNVVNKGWPSVPFVGSGGALGVILSMYVHKRWLR
ncbi:MAG: hypothetical protein P8Y24_11290 [Gammaproteobacteria bacterium]